MVIVLLASGFLAGSGAMATASWQDTKSIQAAAEQAARNRFGDTGGDVSIRADTLDPRLRLPACDTPLLGELPENQRESGRVTAQVRCTGSSPWRLYVPVRVVVMKDVVVTATPLARGKVLTGADVKLARREVGSAPTGYFTLVDAVVGQVLRRSIPAGTVLSPGQLDAPVVVERGRPVTLQVRSGGIMVQMAGIAKANGTLGEIIPVENVSSGKVVQGIVRNEKSIEVLLP